MNPVKMSNLVMPTIVQGTPSHHPLTRPYAPYMSPIPNYTYGATEGGDEERRVFGVKVSHIAYGAAILAVAYGVYRYTR